MKIVSRKVIDDFAVAEYRRHYANMDQPVSGILEAVRLIDKREFIFRSQAYRVPPIPWRLAAELLDAKEKLRALTNKATGPNAMEETIALFHRIAQLSKKVCEPAGPLRRLFWPIMRNPFQKATTWEVGRNLGFFLMFLALDKDSPAVADLKALHRSGMSNLISPDLSPDSPRGPTPRGSRSRGVTSSMESGQ